MTGSKEDPHLVRGGNNSEARGKLDHLVAVRHPHLLPRPRFRVTEQHAFDRLLLLAAHPGQHPAAP